MDDILCPGQTASEQRPANKVIWNMLSKCLACLVGSQNKHSNGLAYSVHLPCRLGGGQSLKAGLWWCSACCWCHSRWCCPAACSGEELVTIEWIWWVSPVQSYAQHPVLPQCPQEQIYVPAPRLPVLHQGAILQRYLANPANIFVHLHFNQLEKLECAKAAWPVCLCLLATSGSFCVLLDSFRPYWSVLVFTGPYRYLLVLTGPNWILLGLTGPYWGFICIWGLTDWLISYIMTYWCAYTPCLASPQPQVSYPRAGPPPPSLIHMVELGFVGLLNIPKQIFAQVQKLEVKLART